MRPETTSVIKMANHLNIPLKTQIIRKYQFPISFYFLGPFNSPFLTSIDPKKTLLVTLHLNLPYHTLALPKLSKLSAPPFLERLIIFREKKQFREKILKPKKNSILGKKTPKPSKKKTFWGKKNLNQKNKKKKLPPPKKRPPKPAFHRSHLPHCLGDLPEGALRFALRGLALGVGLGGAEETSWGWFLWKSFFLVSFLGGFMISPFEKVPKF